MASMDFVMSKKVGVAVTVTEVDGNLEFHVRVLQPGEEGYTGKVGELNGFFFDMAGNVDAYTGLTATTSDGEDLCTRVDEGSVSHLGSGINMKGRAIKETGKFDVGAVLAKRGLCNGDLQEITFTLDADQDLSLEDVAQQDFGVHLTSIGPPGGCRRGQDKITGCAPDVPVDDVPPPPLDLNLAADDFIFVTSDAEFDGIPESIDFASDTILWNDTTESSGATSAYEGDVVSANGIGLTDGYVIVEGSNGGLLTVYADGTVDFSANGEFGHLTEFDFDTTYFTYAIEGGDTATIEVVVEGPPEDIIFL